MWHHIMNRGLAKRTVFENEQDIRTFLARLAWRVHARQLEVHAFCVLTTHFHLLARSPQGELSEAMRLTQNEYTRWFNRTRRRDGPLFRGRFRSKPVRTIAYRRYLIRYIDFNPVSAGLVPAPALFPHGSARHYACARGPAWLERSWVEQEVKTSTGAKAYRPADYARSFGAPITPQLSRLIEKRIAHCMPGEDPLDRLLDGATDRVCEWMRRKAELADGVRVGEPVCAEEDVLSMLQDAEQLDVAWRVRPTRKTERGWDLVRVALLRDLCGSTLTDVATRTGQSVGVVWKRYERHKRCLGSDPDYSKRVSELGAEALRRCHGTGEDARIGEKVT